MTDDHTPHDALLELQTRLAAFTKARDWGQFHTPRNLAACLSVEAAELLELFMWTREGPGPHPPGAGPPPEHRMREEIADVLLSLLNFASAVGIDPVQAALDKLNVLENKYPVHLARGSAVKASDRMAAEHAANSDDAGEASEPVDEASGE
ncbi:MAG: nucleotide pyrophosphohydrolase [Bradymonadia bacterium]